MAFHDAPFPLEVKSLRAASEWRTIVTETGSGGESRTAVWADARRVYQANLASMTLATYDTLEKHFNGRRGRLHSFPLVDRYLSTATTEGFGTGGNVTAAFQLTINRGDSTNAYNREIYKPVNDSNFKVFVNAVQKTSGVHYNCDFSTGLVTFTGGNIPTAGQVLTWSGSFRVPVRYDLDKLDPNLFIWHTNGSLLEGPEILLVETRDIA